MEPHHTPNPTIQKQHGGKEKETGRERALRCLGRCYYAELAATIDRSADTPTTVFSDHAGAKVAESSKSNQFDELDNTKEEYAGQTGISVSLLVCLNHHVQPHEARLLKPRSPDEMQCRLSACG